MSIHLPKSQNLSSAVVEMSCPPAAKTGRNTLTAAGRVALEEIGYLSFRLLVSSMLAVLLPIRSGPRLRSAMLRFVGVHVGRGTMLFGWPTILASKGFESKLTIGNDCWFN